MYAVELLACVSACEHVFVAISALVFAYVRVYEIVRVCVCMCTRARVCNDLNKFLSKN